MSWVFDYLKLAEARFDTAKQNLQRVPLEVEQAVNDAQRRLAGAQMRVAETAEKGRTTAEVALSGLGETGSMIGDVLNMPLEALGINELIGKGAEAVMQTETGQAAMQKAQELQQEYPRASENAGNLFGALNIIPGMQAPRVAGQAANKMMRNVDTMVEGGPLKRLEAPLQKMGVPSEGMFSFYGGLPPLSFAGEALQAIPGTVREIFSPTARANERAKGVSQRRVDEVTGPESSKGELDVGSAYAGENIYRQTGRDVDETLIATVPMTAKNTRLADSEWNEANVRREIFEPLDEVPIEVQDRAVNHVKGVHGAGDNTHIVVREPQTQGFTKEGKGSAGRGSPAIRTLTSKNTISAYAKHLGKSVDELSTDDIAEITKASFIVNNKRLLRQLEKEFPGVGQQKIIERYLKGKSRQQAGGTFASNSAEKKLLDFLDNSFEEFGGRVSKDGDFIYLSQGYHSEMKDLGGVNQFIAIDTKNRDVYTLISDRHDMFGLDAVGGQGLVTIGTMEKVRLGGGYDPEVNALKKSERQARVQKREQDSVAKTEEMTGIKRRKNESATDYSKRVLRDSNFTPEAKDYLESLYRGSWAITAATELDNGKERR